MLNRQFIVAAKPPKKPQNYYAALEFGGNGLAFEIRNSQDIKNAPARDNFDRRRKETIRSSEEIRDQDSITEETIDKIIDILKRERDAINRLVADGHTVTVKCIGTAPLRLASNSLYIMKRIEDEVGFVFEAIDGDQEAALAANGLLEFYPEASGVMVDMGGATTEFALIENGKITKTQSIPIGTSTIKKKKEAKAALNELDPEFLSAKRVFCIGGTFRNINKSLAQEQGKDIKGGDLHTCKPREYAAFIEKLLGLNDKKWDKMHESLQIRKDFIPAAQVLFAALSDEMENLKEMALVKVKTRDGTFVYMRDVQLRWEHDLTLETIRKTDTSPTALMA